MSRYIIEVTVDVDAGGLEQAALTGVAARAMEHEAVAAGAELSIVLTDDATVQRLNHQYRGVDAPTDVLSFGQRDADIPAPPDGEAHLGDVVISLDTARRQAGEYGIPLDDEVAHLVVHGVLHLLGYDHETPDDASVMRAREDAILGEVHHH